MAALTGCAVGGGGARMPKPSSVCSGGSTLGASGAPASLAVPVPPPSATPDPSADIRRSISTNRPDSGRLDQSELAVTWKRMIWPSPNLRSVTRGVPSCRRAHTCTSGPSIAGSASTWRLTVTSGGTGVPAKRLLSSIGASFCGVDHDRAPPSVRPPTRSGTGSSSSPPFSRREPAKRTSTPPFFTHSSTCLAASPDSVPMSASMSTLAFCASAS